MKRPSQSVPEGQGSSKKQHQHQTGAITETTPDTTLQQTPGNTVVLPTPLSAEQPPPEFLASLNLEMDQALYGWIHKTVDAGYQYSVSFECLCTRMKEFQKALQKTHQQGQQSHRGETRETISIADTLTRLVPTPRTSAGDETNASPDDPADNETNHAAAKPPTRETTLVSALQAHKLIRMKHSLLSIEAATRIEQKAQLQEISQKDVATLGVVILYNLFGTPGQKRIALAIHELYGPSALERRGTRSIRLHGEHAAAAIREDGSEELAAFVSDFGFAVRHDHPTGTAGDNILALYKKVQISRLWDKWRSEDASNDKTALTRFLNEKNIPRTRGLTVMGRVSRYLQWHLPELKEGLLKSKVYQWRPIQSLVGIFGYGILAFVPKSLTTAYSRHPVTNSDSPMPKGEILKIMAQLIKAEVRQITEYVEASRVLIVDVLISGEDVAPAAIPFGIATARNMRLKDLEKWEITELLGIDHDVQEDSSEIDRLSDVSTDTLS